MPLSKNAAADFAPTVAKTVMPGTLDRAPGIL
jgi:hypothetical protein